MTIEDWQEYIAALPDKQFFFIMRLYLGEIKTPYNKQRLISQLAGFIHNEQNSATMISLLEEFDLKLLSAVHLISGASENTLIDFFATEYEPSKIYAGIVNLTERLYIFTRKNFNKEYFYINPLLIDRLKPLLHLNKILPPVQIVTHSDDDIFSISPNFIAAYISYMKIQKCTSKLDGTLKKNDLKHLELIFPGRLKCIELLTTAFMNLSILRDKNGSFEIDDQRLLNFSELPQNQQYAFLCAASVSRFGREGLKNQAQLLLDCLASVPEGGVTRSNFVRLAFIINSGVGAINSSAKSRFSQLLDNARSQAMMESSLNDANLLERMLDSVIEFGLLQCVGFSETNQEIFVVNKEFFNPVIMEQKPKVLNIDSTFTATLMPGLQLKDLIPFTNFLLIKKFGVVTEFEVSRKSLSYYFDSGKTPDELFELVESASYYELPQNLKASFIDWYSSYSAVALYKGYVLKVSDSNVAIVENNPKIKHFLKEKLAPGIYLLNIPAEEDISIFTEASGLELLGSIKMPQNQSEQIPFPLLRPGRSRLLNSFKDENLQVPDSEQIDKKAANDFLLKLTDIVEKSDFDKFQKESLLNRISRRLIISASQLTPSAIRSEILEADGMDFSGKLHLIEAAIKDSDLLEITMPDYKGGENYFTLVGTPLGLSKNDDEAVLRISVRPADSIENIIVSRITYLRRLKF